jgi:hypothetical protein
MRDHALGRRTGRMPHVVLPLVLSFLAGCRSIG